MKVAIKNYLLASIGLFGFFYCISIFTGVAPISPSSHKIIHDFVEENPNLKTMNYIRISEELFISINDKNLLFDEWEMILMKEYRHSKFEKH